ncbi:MAG: hypothetical protein AAF552_09275 [Pseudomonadota bacterium]
MKANRIALLLGLLAVCLGVGDLRAQSSVYQAELWFNGQPAAGAFDFRIGLYDVAEGGTPLADDELFVDQIVTGGIIYLPIDFGGALYAGLESWLSVQVRPSGQAMFTQLTPRWQVPATSQSALALRLEPDAVSTAAIVDGSVTSDDLADAAVGAAQVATGAIETRHLAAGAVSNNNIAAGAVASSRLDDASVGAAELATATLGAREIGDGAVGGSEIAPSAIGTGALADGAVSTRSLVAGEVGAEETVRDHIAAGAVTQDKIAAGAVGSQQINSNEVQRRLGAACSNRQGVRAVSSTGALTCATDRRGLYDLGTPVASLLAFSSGNGSQTRIVGSTATHLCQLAFVQVEDVDNSAEVAACALFPDASGNWILEAFVTPGRDATAFCEAICQSLQVDP